MSSAFSMTARDIVTQAMRELRVIASGEQPSAEELADGLVRLNAMLKSWQGRGVGALDRTAQASVTIPPVTSSILLPTDVADVVAARLVQASYDRPLLIAERDEFFSIPNRLTAGLPTMVYVERAVDSLRLHVWPVPAAGAVLSLDTTRKFEAVTDASAPIDMAQDWQECLYANLAVRIAGMFGAPIPDELAMRAQRLEQALLDADRPASYILEPW